ncbi:MAG: hypothetical protein IT539_00945 [Bradyrhizobiaceae bacterium]|nr:hypothetical protein [Bradyrhizobiaceae bacterium]
MSVRKIIRAFVGGADGKRDDKRLPPVDYSGEPSDADIDAIRKAYESEVKSDNLKTIEGPAW